MPRMATTGREEWKTFASVFDRFTEKQVQSLITKGVIDGLIGHLSMGKEATVFLAKAKDETVIIKVYRLSTCDFNRMYESIRTDPRFPKLNRQRRKVVFAWAQREFRNLLKAREAGVRVPTPITHLFNVLVMELVGDETAAQKVKDALPKRPAEFIEDLIAQMRKLYKAGLVHGDLSPFNILNSNEKPVIIDMSQTTTLEDPNAKEYLTRDIKNVVSFANKLGVELTVDELGQKVKA
ncbi:serine protein kinase RIO [Candidatus Woesearchaeota archaeon]|nr:serine protein kinase RIO [Candidatus Woesearchaeota archaeon]